MNIRGTGVAGFAKGRAFVVFDRGQRNPFEDIPPGSVLIAKTVSLSDSVMINFKNVVDLAFDHRFFVIRRNQDRHGREFGSAIHHLFLALENFTHKWERHRKKQIAMDNQEQKNPECNLSIKEYIFTHFEIHSFSFSRIW